MVIDTFGGSGSTFMACEQMNRICCMMELDEKYASVILRRYVEDTGNAEGVYVIRNGQQILTPRTLLFAQDDTTVMLFDCAWDIENGIAVRISPEMKVGSPDCFL